jgi:hypothetical protein
MRIAAEVIPSCSSNLGKILKELQCPFKNLHSAGNDAHFTLRSLLLLATKSYVGATILEPEDQQRLEFLKSIGYYPLPEQISKERKKKIKRLQRNRKHQAKSWDIDTQERIRAERAARRRRLADTENTTESPSVGILNDISLDELALFHEPQKKSSESSTVGGSQRLIVGGSWWMDAHEQDAEPR